MRFKTAFREMKLIKIRKWFEPFIIVDAILVVLVMVLIWILYQAIS